MTLFVTYPVLTIQSTVSATSSGVPSLPIGISAEHQHSAHQQETNTYTLRQLLAAPRQHLRLLDQRRRNPIDSDTLRSVCVGKPVHETMERGFRRPGARQQMRYSPLCTRPAARLYHTYA